MKFKNYLFDLDGVLTDTNEIHFKSTLNAFLIVKGYELDTKYHKIIKSSITTINKLNILQSKNIIETQDILKIYNLKKVQCNKEFQKINFDKVKNNLFSYLKKKKCKIAVVTNSNKESAKIILKNLGVFDYIDLLLSNNDVNNKKPHSEPYIRAISYFGDKLENYIIFEDSDIGLQSAYGTGSYVYKVSNYKDINIKTINKINNIRNINILIPMAGLGSRFVKRGFKKIKPLIEIAGVPMVKKAIDSLNIEGNYIFIVRSNENLNELKDYLYKYKPNCKIIDTPVLTEGSASSCYLAKELINNNDELIITNCDQYLEWNSDEFIEDSRKRNLDCNLLTYDSNNDKNSFIKLDENNNSLMIREKEVISNNALVGVHYFKKGNYFIESYDEIFKNKIKFKNEYYVSTICDNMIKKGYNVNHFKLDKIQNYHSLGTPEDYFKFLKYINKLNIKKININTMFRGWFIGDFEPSVYRNKYFEVGYLLHKKGEVWDVHYHKHIKEINLLVKGKMILNDLEINENEIFVIDKEEIACPIFLEDCYIIVIKIPSVPGDKIIL